MTAPQVDWKRTFAHGESAALQAQNSVCGALSSFEGFGKNTSVTAQGGQQAITKVHAQRLDLAAQRMLRRPSAIGLRPQHRLDQVLQVVPKLPAPPIHRLGHLLGLGLGRRPNQTLPHHPQAAHRVSDTTKCPGGVEVAPKGR